MTRVGKKATSWSRVHVYVEGGGETRRLQEPIKEGFGRLFRAACPGLPAPRVIACGGRSEAFEDFQRGLRANPEALCLLLVDSEAAVDEGAGPWAHVKARRGDGWKQPAGVKDEQLHFMAQAMEAWLLADPDALAAHFKQGFVAGAVSKATDLERVAKRDLAVSLERASTRSKPGRYTKAQGFVLIGTVDPAKIAARCPRYGARFFARLREALAAIKR